MPGDDKHLHLADPDFEPTDEPLQELSRRAFSGAAAANARALRRCTSASQSWPKRPSTSGASSTLNNLPDRGEAAEGARCTPRPRS